MIVLLSKKYLYFKLYSTLVLVYASHSKVRFKMWIEMKYDFSLGFQTEKRQLLKLQGSS